MALNLYSTYENFNNLRNHTNDPAAWLRFASSGSQAFVDVGSFSVRAMGGISEGFAALEIAAPFEAVGGAMVAVLILADRFYEAGKMVGDEEDFLHKNFSYGTKFTEFWDAVLGFSSAYQGKINAVVEYKSLLVQLQDFLKKHPELKYYVSSALHQIDTKRKCVHRPLTGKGCRQYQYTPIFEQIKNNAVNFLTKQTGFQLNNEVQDAFPGGEFVCLPTGDDISVPNQGTYRCEGAFALSNPTSTGTSALFNLGEGEDRALGFKNLTNLFIINNGGKSYVGGDQDDLFILSGTQIVTATQNNEFSGLQGGQGLDSLDLRPFKPAAVSIVELNLPAKSMHYGNHNLQVTSMERILGGSTPLSLTVACETTEIDTSILSVPKSPDSIFIPSNLDCNYNLGVHLRPNMSLTNAAEQGHFVYSVLPGRGSVLVDLLSQGTNLTGDSINHQFEFNAALSEVTAVSVSEPNEGGLRNLNIKFIKKSLSNQSAESFTFELHTSEFNHVFLRFNDQGRLKIGNKNLYYLHSDLNRAPREIIRDYAPLMKQLNLVGLFITPDNQYIVIGHDKHEVMHNNPDAFRTHLYGNGGEGIFVIKPKGPSLTSSFLPIPDVYIYHLPGDTHSDTLDLRYLVQHVQQEMNQTAELFIVPPNAQNNLGDDLLLILGIPSHRHPQQMTPIANVYLPKAFHPAQYHWFKKLEILLKVAPLRIEGRHKHLFLKPVPVVLDNKQEIEKLSISHIEANTTVIIPQAYQEGGFFQHNKTNLIWTTTLSDNDNINRPEPFTLILDKFFQEPKLETLTLQFSDKTLSLSNKSPEFIMTADFAEVANARLLGLHREFLAILNLNSSTNETHQLHEDYLSNEINVTSIENHIDDYLGEEINTISPIFRQRRSVKENSTSGASNLKNWMYIPGIIASSIRQTTGEIFAMLQTTINNFGTYLSATHFSECSDALNQTLLLGNKTATTHRNPIQESPIKQDVPLGSCTSLQLIDSDQEYIEGVSCQIPSGRINFFHSLSYETCPAAFEQREASFANCRPVEWYGRPVVACEGEKVTAMIMPDLPNNLAKQVFDRMDGWLMLGQVILQVFDKFFRSENLSKKELEKIELTKKQKNRWKNKLATIQRKFDTTIDQLDEQAKQWIPRWLEDRKEEYNLFLQESKATKPEITIFNKNIRALQKMLDKIEEIPTHVPPNPQQDKDVFARAAHTKNPSDPSSKLTAYLISLNSKNSFFGLTQLNSVENTNPTRLRLGNQAA